MYSRALVSVLLCFTAFHSYSETYTAVTDTGIIVESETTGPAVNFNWPSASGGSAQSPTGSSAHQYCGQLDPNLNCFGQHGFGRVPTWDGVVLRYGWGAGMYTEFTGRLEQALQEVGINILGYDWLFSWKNRDVDLQPWDGIPDPATVTVKFFDYDGNILHEKEYDFTGRYDWTNFTGTELFDDAIKGSEIESIRAYIHGQDQDGWGGTHGPEFWANNNTWAAGDGRSVGSSIELIFTRDPCYDNPQYDPGCPGYQAPFVLQSIEEDEHGFDSQQGYDSSIGSADQDSVDGSFSNPGLNSTAGVDSYEDADTRVPTESFNFGPSGDGDSFSNPGLEGAVSAQEGGDQEGNFFSQTEQSDVYNSESSSLSSEGDEQNTINSANQIAISGGRDENQNGVASSQSEMANGLGGNETQDNNQGTFTDLGITLGFEGNDGQGEEASNNGDQDTEYGIMYGFNKGEISTDYGNQNNPDADLGINYGDQGDLGFYNFELEREAQEEQIDNYKERKKVINNSNMVLLAKAENHIYIDDEEFKRRKEAEIIAKRLEREKRRHDATNDLAKESKGFESYRTSLYGGGYPDVEFYEPKRLPESRRGLRNGLAQQLLHEQMVDMQYVDSSSNDNYFKR